MAVTYSYYQDSAGQWWRLNVETDGSITTVAVSGPGVTPSSPNVRQVKVMDIITNAMLEIGVLAPGETPSSPEATFALSKLNRLLDNWNAEELFVYDVQFTRLTLTPNKNPHTIGPVGADFSANPRPVDVEFANLILTDQSPEIRKPLGLIDDIQWASIRVQSLATQYPLYMHYHRDWPNGQILLWPVPTYSYDIELVTRTSFNSFVALTDPISFPPGYEDAMTLTLAESLCPTFTKALDAVLANKASEARARIKSQNIQVPELGCDDGLISNGLRFNWITGDTAKLR